MLVKLPELMIGWTTLPDRETASALARALVDARLAACVQVSGPIESLYRWEGSVETSTEWRVAAKFAAEREPEVRALVESRHPYEVPQWLCVRVDAGSEKYLNWVIENST